MKRAQLLAALDSVRAWAKDLSDEVDAFRLQPIPGLIVQVRDGRSANAEKCSRYRQRRATRVATGVTTPSDTKVDTGPTRVATGVRPVSRPVSNTESSPRPSSPPLHSPSDSLTPSDPKESAAGSEGSDRLPAGEQQAAAATVRVHVRCGTPLREGEHGLFCPMCDEVVGMGRIPAEARDWSKRPPSSPDEALEMPLQERAEFVLRDTFRAQFIEPHRWPEVRLAIVAFRSAVGKAKLAVGSFGTDPGVRRLVELYAAGLTADEVCTAIPLVVASSWWTSGDAPRDLGSLSLTVVRRALAERKPAQPSELEALPRAMFGGGS